MGYKAKYFFWLLQILSPYTQSKVPPVTISNSWYPLIPLSGTLCHWEFPVPACHSGPSPEDTDPPPLLSKAFPDSSIQRALRPPQLVTTIASPRFISSLALTLFIPQFRYSVSLFISNENSMRAGYGLSQSSLQYHPHPERSPGQSRTQP